MISELYRLSSLLSRVVRSQSNLVPVYCNSKVKNMSTTRSSVDQSDIVWMDLEMTGLEVEKDKILEVSCIVTDKQLKIKSKELCFAINYPADVYQNMNEWCIKHHNESGLIDRCKESNVKPDQAEGIILSFLKENIPERQCPLAGNTIYMDRMFIRKYFPSVDEYLHYRIIDVSTIKELAKRWNPDVLDAAPKKTFAHRSLEDIRESISELQYYKEHLFK